MPTVKTAVSLDRALFERTEAMAKKMSVPRSRLHALALDEFLRRKEYKEIFDSWNKAYADGLDEDEKELIKEIEEHHWANLEDEAW